MRRSHRLLSNPDAHVLSRDSSLLCCRQVATRPIMALCRCMGRSSNTRCRRLHPTRTRSWSWRGSGSRRWCRTPICSPSRSSSRSCGPPTGSRTSSGETQRPMGWTWPGFRVLFWIWLLGPLEPRTIASLVSASRASISSALNTLERDGFVVRSRGSQRPAAGHGRPDRPRARADPGGVQGDEQPRARMAGRRSAPRSRDCSRSCSARCSKASANLVRLLTIKILITSVRRTITAPEPSLTAADVARPGGGAAAAAARTAGGDGERRPAARRDARRLRRRRASTGSLQPRRFGGYEFGLRDFVRVMSEISRGCPSSGWVLALTAGHPHLLAHFSEQAQAELYGENGDVRVPGRPVQPGDAPCRPTAATSSAAPGTTPPAATTRRISWAAPSCRGAIRRISSGS